MQRTIGRIEHLASALFGKDYQEHYVAVLTAYFDISGKRDRRWVTVGAYVSTVDKWKRFDAKWIDHLARYNVAVFHMTDFVSSQREFKGWKGQTARRRNFVKGLVRLIRDYTETGITLSVCMDDYNIYDKEYGFSETKLTPEVLCRVLALYQIKKWLPDGVKPVDVACIVEAGDPGLGDLVNFGLQPSLGFSISPGIKAIPALQACDLAAWKLTAAQDDALYRGKEYGDVMASMKPIEKTLGLGVTQVSHRGFQDIVRKYKLKNKSNGVPQ